MEYAASSGGRSLTRNAMAQKGKRAKRVETPPHDEASRKNIPMTRDEALDLLGAHKATLSERFGVTALALFGSVARNQASADSDVDILVRFDGPTTSRNYFGAQFYLEDLIGRPVDLVTDKALRPELRPYVEQEAVDV